MIIITLRDTKILYLPHPHLKKERKKKKNNNPGLTEVA